ncbi:MAG: alpha/beta fold hydrolase [Ktedonobacterales bacterium]
MTDSTPSTTGSSATTGDAKGSYANINGLNLYYEVHGSGQPLVLLHGGFMTIDALGPLLPALAASRRVIAVELEGHGHTADLDRPLTPEQMAEDIAGLL